MAAAATVESTAPDTSESIEYRNPTGTLWNRWFWAGAGERAIKTFAQAALGALGVGAVGDAVEATTGQTILSAEWTFILGTGALAALVSLLMAVANPQFISGIHVRETVRITETRKVPVVTSPASPAAAAVGATPETPRTVARATIGDHAAVTLTVDGDDEDADQGPILVQYSQETP